MRPNGFAGSMTPKGFAGWLAGWLGNDTHSIPVGSVRLAQ